MSGSASGCDAPLVEPLEGPLKELQDAASAAAFYTVKPSELKVLGLLGSGAQADVFKAEWVRTFASSSTSIVVAVKRMHSMDTIYRDREALGFVTDHPNLVKCFDCTLDPPYLIVTEFCSGGSLFDLLYNSRVELSPRQQIKILLDAASGMKYLHDQKPAILHRDLKSGNVLLMGRIRSTTQEPVAKVGDFGLSRSDGQDMTVGVGSCRWMAPELFAMEAVSKSYDLRVDVFSFAMLMYEVLVRKIPYTEEYPSDSMDPRIALKVTMGMRPQISDVASQHPEVLKELMTRAWDADPEKRPNFEELEMSLKDIHSAMPPPPKREVGPARDGVFRL